MNWEEVAISDFCRTGSGGTPSRSKASRYYGGSIPWVKSGELREESVYKTEEYVTEDALRESAIKLVPPGALLIAMYGATVGRMATLKIEATTNQAVCHIVPDEKKADLNYLNYALQNKVPYLLKKRVGGGQPNISQQIIKDTKIPLPPLPEQRRIAAILDKADAIRRKRQQAIRLTEEFLRSVFLDMFGDPVLNPKGWEVRPLGDVLEAIDSGWSANGEDRARRPDERAVLKISSVTSGRFIPSEYKVVPAKAISRELITPKRGDLLFSRANTRELVAATCLVEKDEPQLFLPDKLWRITPNKVFICSEYLKYLLSHPRFRENFTKQATGTSGSMLNISMAKLRGLGVPLPPINLQQEFAKRVWTGFGLQERVNDSTEEMDCFFNALVQSAFRGEL